MRNPHPKPKVVESQQPAEIGHNEPPKAGHSDRPDTEVIPDATDLSAEHYIEAAKASAQANKPKKSDYEKAAIAIKQAARVLERIVEGDLKDNGAARQENKLGTNVLKIIRNPYG